MTMVLLTPSHMQRLKAIEPSPSSLARISLRSTSPYICPPLEIIPIYNRHIVSPQRPLRFLGSPPIPRRYIILPINPIIRLVLHLRLIPVPPDRVPRAYCRDEINEEGRIIEGEDEGDRPFEDGGRII